MNGDVGEHSHDKGGRSIVMNLGGSWGVLGGVIEGCFGGSDKTIVWTSNLTTGPSCPSLSLTGTCYNSTVFVCARLDTQLLTQMLLKIAAVLSLETWVVFGKHLVLASLNGSKLYIAEELNSRNLGKVCKCICVVFLQHLTQARKRACL